MSDGDYESPGDTKRDEILAMRELTAELKIMRSSIERFNLFIAGISQKAGNIAGLKTLLDMFIGMSGSSKK